MRKVLTHDIPNAEIAAYALARYSRSAKSITDILGELTAEKSASFIDTYVTGYGHNSVKDLAHLIMTMENVSIHAAIELEDEPLWDGQERSTRYQDFSKSGYYVPAELATKESRDLSNEDAARLYKVAVDRLFQTYQETTTALVELIKHVIPRPVGMPEGDYKRTINARVLDVTRALLPYATYTSVGQITSARVLERQIARLLASPYQEIQDIAGDMKTAGLTRIPTLLKYSVASKSYKHLQNTVSFVVREAFQPYKAKLTEPAQRPGVTMVDVGRGGYADPVVEAVASMFYQHVSGLSFLSALDVARDLSENARNTLYKNAMAGIDVHDDWYRAMYSGAGRAWDICLDTKSMQDFFRHRRCTQVRQAPFMRLFGFLEPDFNSISLSNFTPAREWFALCLPADVLPMVSADLYDNFDAAIGQAIAAARTLFDCWYNESAIYVLPVAYRRRALFRMDDAQAAYVIKTRSGSGGHPAYRQAAYQMWQEYKKFNSTVAEYMRVTPFSPGDTTNFLKR